MGVGWVMFGNGAVSGDEKQSKIKQITGALGGDFEMKGQQQILK